MSDYLPEIAELERNRFLALELVVDALEALTVTPFAIPFDFADGYQPAFWRRPRVPGS